MSHYSSVVLAHVKHRKASVRTLLKSFFFWFVHVRYADRLLSTSATDERSRYTSFESWELHESLFELTVSKRSIRELSLVANYRTPDYNLDPNPYP